MANTNDKFDFSFNPFVGPHPIETGRNIFGRNREIDDLYYLLSAERIVMLHSPSGAGKTSLIQAGLIPRLTERFDVWGPTRVNQLPSANSAATVNRYIRSAVLGFEQQVPTERPSTEDKLTKMTLAEYVASRREESKNIVLIFDQFEEILTADPLAIDAKREFFKQLGELLLDPRIWALFAMREDYLPALDPYAEQVPTHLKNWFRLDLLRRDKATEAITETAKEGGRQFDSEAVTELVTDLATMKVQQPDGTFASQKGLYVEPLQLQVVCRRLWERMPADKRTIDLDEVEQSGDVTTALADYYSAEVARLAGGDARVERKLREWVGEELITSDGIRSQVLRVKDNSKGLDNELILNLVNTHLVRGEQREGATWYELAHDRLIEPIRNNNRDWFDTHLHKVQKLAALWERERGPTGLLLLGQDLIEANEWLKQNEAASTKTERRFLKDSANKQESIDKEERQAKRLRKLLVTLAALALLALGAAGYALISYLESRYQQSVAQYQETNAVENQREAEKSARQAFLQKTLAGEKQIEAEAAKRAEEFQKELLQGKERELQKSLEDSHSLLYAANQLLAWNAFDQKDYLRANDILEASFPASGTKTTEDTRGFDWFYLWRQIHDEKHTLKGHTGRVESVSFSPDGLTLASGGDDRTVKLWNLLSGQEKVTLKDHTGRVVAVSFSPDGRTLVSGSWDKTVKVWDVDSGKVKVTLGRHSASISSVSFSPDGLTLAIGSLDGTVTLWNLVSGQKKFTQRYHDGSISSVTFSPDGHMLASSGSHDNTVRLLDVASGQEKMTLKGHAASVWSVTFSLDGRTLASGSDDGTVKLWDLTSGQVRMTLPSAITVRSVAFSPDGRTLVSGCGDGTLKLWDVAGGQEKMTLKGHGLSVLSVSFSRDGRTLASGSSDKTVKLWDVGSRQENVALNGYFACVESVSFSPDGLTLASGGGKTVKLWDVVSNREKMTLDRHIGPVYSVKFLPDGRTLASGSVDGAVKLWDVMSGQEKASLASNVFFARSPMSFSPDGRVLAMVGNKALLWDVKHKKEVRKLEHASSIRLLSFSPDGRTLASGGWDGSVRLWDVESGRELKKLGNHEGILSVSFSPDGKTLASGSDFGSVKLWDVVRGQEKVTLKGHAGAVYSVMFSPDSRTLVSGSGDRTVRLWDSANGKELRKLEGHSFAVYSVTFSPDGRTVASGGGGDILKNGKETSFGEIMLWRAAKDDEVMRQCVRCGRIIHNTAKTLSIFGEVDSTAKQNE